MGTHYKRAIFNEHLQGTIIGWAEKAKKKKGQKADSQPEQGSSHEGAATAGAGAGVQLATIFQKRASAPENTTPVPRAEGSN